MIRSSAGEAAKDKPRAGSVFMNKGNYPMGLNGGYKMSELENKGAENLTEARETAKEKKKREKAEAKEKRSRRERPLWPAARRRRKRKK